MVSFGFYGTTFLGRSIEFNEWPIEEAHSIPNCGHMYEPFILSKRNKTYQLNENKIIRVFFVPRSNNAAVWVIDWLDRDQTFTPNIQGEVNILAYYKYLFHAN
jgi:hypothetical protein